MKEVLISHESRISNEVSKMSGQHNASSLIIVDEPAASRFIENFSNMPHEEDTVALIAIPCGRKAGTLKKKQSKDIALASLAHLDHIEVPDGGHVIQLAIT